MFFSFSQKALPVVFFKQHYGKDFPLFSDNFYVFVSWQSFPLIIRGETASSQCEWSPPVFFSLFPILLLSLSPGGGRVLPLLFLYDPERFRTYPLFLFFENVFGLSQQLRTHSGRCLVFFSSFFDFLPKNALFAGRRCHRLEPGERVDSSRVPSASFSLSPPLLPAHNAMMLCGKESLFCRPKEGADIDFLCFPSGVVMYFITFCFHNASCAMKKGAFELC